MMKGTKSFAYDSENHLMTMAASGTSVSLVYDGDGNRVSKTVNGISTQYLVDDLNPTGYPQVVEELSGAGVVTRQYTYGLQRIDENQILNGAWTPSFYSYDGGGNVRNLTNAGGTITDSYEYDAFGNVFTVSGTTPNNYLYRGEQYDQDLSLYYLRARYYNRATGRFMSRDPEDGKPIDPQSLHKYLYAGGDPVNLIDPTGRADEGETGLTFALIDTAPLPYLTELAGGAYAAAESYAAAAALRLAETAASISARVAAWREAMDIIGLTKGLTRVFLCAAAAVTIRALINNVVGGIPFSIYQSFASKCIGSLNGIPFP